MQTIKILVLLLAVVPAIGFGAAPPSADEADDKLLARAAKMDQRLVKALEELAKKYDALNDPEGAHLLASCALGFGSKDPKIPTIKGAREVELFVGKLRGGELLTDANPIDTALRGIAYDLKKFLEPLFPRLKAGELSPAAKNLVHDLVPKYEIARGAHEYIQATQRFNALRRAMGLRALLWDFQNSQQLILACWYMGETEDFRTDEKSDTASPLYSEAVELVKTTCSKMVFRSLKDYPDDLRPFALVRQDLLNPDARTLWLAHWSGGRRITPMSVYAIPPIGFRTDIPTPSERYARETVVEAWPGWRDTENTLEIGGRKVPLAFYPYEAEPDAPVFFSSGRGGQEAGWAPSEHDFLKKAGLPIMLRVFMRKTPTEAAAELKSKTGKNIPLRLYLSGDSRVRIPSDSATIIAVPVTHLDGGTEYDVHMRFKLGDTSVERAWSFRTRGR